jgi:hypothetical protein
MYDQDWTHELLHGSEVPPTETYTHNYVRSKLKYHLHLFLRLFPATGVISLDLRSNGQYIIIFIVCS